MIYNFKNKLFNDFKTFAVNKMAGRSYYIPFNSVEQMRQTTYLNERYNSDMITLLNGTWNVIYFDDCRKLPEQFDSQININKYTKVDVPGCIQFQGFEKPVYINARYEFKPAPPKVPKNSPVTLYSRTFTLEKVTVNEIITFLGVASCLELYVNGEFVGYSEGAHNTAEFNLTQYLQEGENEIVCLVYKWCNGTYLECQDMFRNNGIFRDVYLTHYGDTYINDFAIEPKLLSKGRYELYIHSDVVGKLYSLIYTIKKGDKILHTITINSGEKIRYVIDDAEEWTAETPELYTLEIELIDNRGLAMCLRRDFGLKTVEIRGNIFYFNNVAIKLRGVNHHDTNEEHGYYMTVQDYQKDIEAMKKLNVNSIRMSHYPPDPIFVMMCEHYGMYVIDEADIETHGMWSPEYYNPKGISHNNKWKEHFWDRVSRMYERDKNSVAITLWSLGNESFGYKCHDYCYDKLKKLTTIPIHYEGVRHQRRFAYDVISEMYTPTSNFKKYLDGKLSKKFYQKPYMLCEYAHAMGVGPGDLDAYWNLWYKNESFMGGLIWEWRDHAVKHTDKNDKILYTYGGDHGEVKHDGNFCVDGLMFPNGAPHTGALCMKNVYSPIRTYRDGDNFIICNRQDFLNSSNVKIMWSVYNNGHLIKESEVANIIMPKSNMKFSPCYNAGDDADSALVMTYLSKETGDILGEDCVILTENMPKIDLSAPCKFINSGENLRVSFDGGNLTISLLSGLITSYKVDGVPVINNKPLRSDGLAGFVGNVYTAPIDNYRNLAPKWEKIGLNQLQLECLSVDYNEENSVIKTRHCLKFGKKKLIEYITTYTIGQSGDIKIDSEFKSLSGAYDLPRIGYSLEMAKDFTNIEYYGLGDVENYSDFNNQAKLGIFKTTSDKMLQRYIKPQENGNRSEVRWTKITNDDGIGLEFVAVDKPFNFNAKQTTLDNLRSAKHQEDVQIMDLNEINIDGFMRGIGSNSCGPDTEDKFKYILKKDNPFKFSFVVRPIKK